MASDPFIGTMTRLYARAVDLVRSRAGERDTCHHDVCSILCSEFDCWEQEVDVDTYTGGERMPTWVMYIVSGIMREEGLSGGCDCSYRD